MALRDRLLVLAFVLAHILYFHSTSQIQSSKSAFTKENALTTTRCRYVQPHDNLPVEREFRLNCSKIAEDDEQQHNLITLKKLHLKKSHIKISTSWHDTAISSYIIQNKCEKYINYRKFIMSHVNDFEADFPLAYSIVVHQGAGQVERLLRAVYRPHNVYCIHIDKKSSSDFYNALSDMASCLPNVFLSRKREDVIYASYSRLQADLNCMEELLDHKVQWRYFINLCGQDFPLKTNTQMVTFLKYIYPENEIESFVLGVGKRSRYTYHWEVGNTISSEYEKTVRKTDKRKIAAPGQMKWFGGSAYMVATREFIDWSLNNKTVQAIFEWSKDTYSPDELLWASLSRMPGAPGFRHPHIKWDRNEVQVVARMVKWNTFENIPGVPEENVVYPKCHGYHKRGICVYGAGDVGWLLRRKHFFANKFDPDEDDFVVQCLEKLLRDQERSEACN